VTNFSLMTAPGCRAKSLLLGSDRLKPRSRGGVDVVACSVCKGDLAACVAPHFLLRGRFGRTGRSRPGAPSPGAVRANERRRRQARGDRSRPRFALVRDIAQTELEGSGEGVFTVERTILSVARAYGLDVEVLVLPVQLLLTARAEQGYATAVVRATPGISRLDRVDALHRLVFEIRAGLPLAAARRQLDALRAAPRFAICEISLVMRVSRESRYLRMAEGV
jgi:Putative threonine/serine exporter